MQTFDLYQNKERFNDLLILHVSIFDVRHNIFYDQEIYLF